jgi:hypothetical protein
MNAMEIIEQVRALNADLVVEDGQLMVRGKGNRLPEDLRTALREHKAEVLVALGVPHDVVLASILRELRPHLTANLQRLPDSSLLVLVNFAILNAFGKYMRELEIRHAHQGQER